MYYTSIKKHLRPYSIAGRRKTTITHAFASAIAPNDIYNEEIIRNAILDLNQDPDKQLLCVYCDKIAETWDHVAGIVYKGEFSGNGHTLGNLLPCCKPCNSSKGNRAWRVFLSTIHNDPSILKKKSNLISRYLKKHSLLIKIKNNTKEHILLNKYREGIFDLMKKADKVAEIIRKNV